MVRRKKKQKHVLVPVPQQQWWQAIPQNSKKWYHEINVMGKKPLAKLPPQGSKSVKYFGLSMIIDA